MITVAALLQRPNQVLVPVQPRSPKVEYCHPPSPRAPGAPQPLRNYPGTLAGLSATFHNANSALLRCSIGQIVVDHAHSLVRTDCIARPKEAGSDQNCATSCDTGDGVFFFFFDEPEQWKQLATIKVKFSNLPALPSIAALSTVKNATTKGQADKYRRSLGDDYIAFLEKGLSEEFKFPFAFRRGSAREGSALFSNIQIHVDAAPFLQNALTVAGITYTGSRTLNELQKFFTNNPEARAWVNRLFKSVVEKISELTDVYAKGKHITVSYLQIGTKRTQEVGKRLYDKLLK